jgi:phosphate uptake regulator
MIDMEIRKVQRTGKSTLIVSLPKKWAKENEIESGSLLYISQNHKGELLLSLPNESETERIAKLDIGSTCGEPLIRDVISCYIAGYRTIEIKSQQMTSMQKRDLHSIVNKLIGPEILEETINKVVIYDLLSSEELKPDRALKRMKNMTRSMIQDAISTLIKSNKELAMDVIQRDNDVDRLNLLIAREFSETLISRSLKQENISPIIFFNYMLAARNLEHMADHASEMAGIASKIDYDLPKEIVDELSKLSSVFANLMEDCIYVLLHSDTAKANQLIDKTVKIKAESLIIAGSFSDKCKDGNLIQLLAARSIERILDHIKNIAELAINLHNAALES